MRKKDLYQRIVTDDMFIESFYVLLYDEVEWFASHYETDYTEDEIEEVCERILKNCFHENGDN